MIRITGLSNVVSSLDAVKSAVSAKFAGILSDAASAVLAESVQLTPVDTGELRARVFADIPAVSSEKVEIGFGYERNGTVYPVTARGSSEEYAVLVHERVEIIHAVGQAKFLETALQRFSSEYLAYLGNAVKEVFQE